MNIKNARTISPTTVALSQDTETNIGPAKITVRSDATEVTVGFSHFVVSLSGARQVLSDESGAETLKFTDVLENMDLEHEATTTHLKERIIVKDTGSLLSLRWDFEFSSDLSLKKDGIKVFVMSDNYNTTDDEAARMFFLDVPIVEIPPPTLDDADGISYPCHWEVDGNSIALAIDADLSNAKYPLVIDPTYLVVSTDLTDAQNTQIHNKIIRQADGKLWVCYMRMDDLTWTKTVCLAYSTDNGQSWTEIIVGDTDINGEQIWPHIALDSQGNIHIVWSGYTQTADHVSVIRYRKYNPSADQIFDEQAFYDNTAWNSYAQSPAISIDGNDDIVIGWQQRAGTASYNIWTVEYNTISQAWSAPTNHTNIFIDGRHQYGAKLIADKHNKTYLAWQGFIGANYQMWYCNYDRQAGWSVKVQLTATAYDNVGQSIMYDQFADVVWVWYLSHGGHYRIVRQNPSGGGPEYITDGVYDAVHPAPSIETGDGTITVVYASKSAASPGISQIFVRQLPSGQSWTEPIQLTNAANEQQAVTSFSNYWPLIGSKRPNMMYRGYIYTWLNTGIGINFGISDDALFDEPVMAGSPPHLLHSGLWSQWTGCIFKQG